MPHMYNTDSGYACAHLFLENMLEMQEALARKDLDYTENITEASIDRRGVSNISRHHAHII